MLFCVLEPTVIAAHLWLNPMIATGTSLGLYPGFGGPVAVMAGKSTENIRSYWRQTGVNGLGYDLRAMSSGPVSLSSRFTIWGSLGRRGGIVEQL